MANSVREQVRGVNEKLRALISRSRESLAGRAPFDVHDVREIAGLVSSMQSIVEEASILRTLDPALEGELEAYKGNLEEMQVALEQVRVMLLARRAHIEAARGHLSTLGMWNAALRLTR